MAKQTSNMRRLRKGDSFTINGETLMVLSVPRNVDENRVKVPVLVEGSTRPSRRTFDANLRVRLN